MSILSGIHELVDQWLELEPIGQPPYYRHRFAAHALSERSSELTSTTEFLNAAYDRIHQNWRDAVKGGYSKPSKENWRWKRHLETSPNNKSLEVTLERAIVRATGENWSNQMPTASGLTGPAADKRGSVDLVYRSDAETYSLIELKVESDTPLFAAIEILLYGLLFVWSRNNRTKLGYDLKAQPVLNASQLNLCVLAPQRYYEKYELGCLIAALKKTFNSFYYRKDLAITFQLTHFKMDVDSLSEPGELVTSVLKWQILD